MRNFSEYVWGRTEKEYIEACENAGLDPQEIYNEFLGKLWNRITGRGQPAQNPMQQQSIVRGSYLRRPRPDDQGKLIPSDKGATSFNRNVGYGNIIASLVDAGIPSLTQNAYSQFLQKYGKPDKNGKIKNFFDVFSRRLSKASREIINQGKTTVDGEKHAIGDPHMNIQGARMQDIIPWRMVDKLPGGLVGPDDE